MPTQRHIVVLGGGGFLMEDDTRLDDFTLALAGKPRPRVCFVPTASGDALTAIEKFRLAFPPSRARASFLSLFNRNAKTLASTIATQDVIYVGGGNTANMLAIWRLHGLDKLLKRAWAAGTVMTGVSAGMNCWFQGCSTDSFGPLAPLNDGLGWLNGAACPHFDGEKERRPSLARWVRLGPARGGLPDAIAADDFAAAHFVGARLRQCVASRPGASVYRVRRVAGKVVEETLPTRLLPV